MRYGDRDIRHTQIADEMLDHWMPHLTGGEWKVLCYLARKIFGWQKRDDTVAIRQFVTGETTKEGQVLDGGTGLKERQVQQILAILVDAGIVAKTERAAPSGKTLPCAFKLNLGVDWVAAKQFLEENRKLYYGNGGKSKNGKGAVHCTLDDPGEGAVDCGERVQSTAPVGVSSTAPMLGTGGVSSTAPTTNKDIYKADNNNNRQEQPSSEAGSKGGEVPTDVVAGGGPRTPLHIDLVAGAAPQTPPPFEVEGAEILTASDVEGLKAAEKKGWQPHEFRLLVKMAIMARNEEIERASRPAPAPPAESPPRPAPPPAPEARLKSKSSGFAPVSGLLGHPGGMEGVYRAFCEGAEKSAVCAELIEWGVRKEKAEEIVARSGAERVMVWMEKAAAKEDKAAYLVSLSQLAIKGSSK
jgi:hypothetical protein